MQAVPVSRAAALQRPSGQVARGSRVQRRIPARPSPSRLLVLAAKGSKSSAAAAPAPAAADVSSTSAPEWVTQPAPFTAQTAQPNVSQPQYSAPPPQAVPAANSGWPWYVWVGVGFLVANVAAKAMQFANPQKMQEMAMQQMMKQMMKQMGSAPPGGAGGAPNPFGFPTPPGGANPFAPGANPFAPGANPFAPGASPFGGAGPGAASPPVDVTATPARGASSSSQPASSSATATTVDTTATPSSSSSSSSGTSGGSKGGFSFTDVEAEVAPSSTATNGAASDASWKAPAANFFEQQAAGGTGAAAEATADPGSEERARAYLNNMEAMLKNPEMQKMLYPYLPEPMRNPETFEWMLNDPTTRKQLEQTLANANLSFDPNAMEAMLQNVPSVDSPEFKAQFEQIGMKPEEMMQKLISEPELMKAFQNPKVQKAVMELSTNPMAIMNYQNDPEVMTVLMKIQELMAPAMEKMQQQQQPSS